jgi:GxxExxY protein
MGSFEGINGVGTAVLDACFRVHRELGPGLLESAYQTCLVLELGSQGVEVECEVELPIHYRGSTIDAGYRIDMIVEKAVVVENKCVRVLHPVHDAQLLTYLKLSNLRLGYLINWNTHLLKTGIHRIVNRL